MKNAALLQMKVNMALVISALMLPASVMANDVMANDVMTNDMTQDNPSKIASENTVNFVLKKGSQYSLCNDLLTYFSKHYMKESEIIHGAFSAPSDIFKQPTYTQVTQKEGLPIDMQHYAYRKSAMEGYTGWVKSTERYAKSLHQRTFYRTRVDINNDGIKDSIQTWRHRSERWTTFANFPLTSYGTLAVEWYI